LSDLSFREDPPSSPLLPKGSFITIGLFPYFLLPAYVFSLLGFCFFLFTLVILSLLHGIPLFPSLFFFSPFSYWTLSELFSPPLLYAFFQLSFGVFICDFSFFAAVLLPSGSLEITPRAAFYPCRFFLSASLFPSPKFLLPRLSVLSPCFGFPPIIVPRFPASPGCALSCNLAGWVPPFTLLFMTPFFCRVFAFFFNWA